jgi:hypothetical protein
MAQVLKVTDGTTTVDFLTGDLKMRAGGWETLSARDVVWETIELSTKAAAASVRTAVNNLMSLFKKARDYEDNIIEQTPVWMYYQSEGESEKRALVLDGSVELQNVDNLGPLLYKTGLLLTVAIERLPFWENTTLQSLTASGKTVDGGYWVAGGAAGDEDQRIYDLAITSNASTALTKFWIGIRPILYGSNGFQPKWECESGTNGTDASDQADATASNNSRVQVTFATVATLAKRFSITCYQAQALSDDWDDLIGDYIILARLKLPTASTEVRIVLKHGYEGGTVGDGMTTICGDVFVSNISNTNLTNWNIVEIGRVKIPSSGNRDNMAVAEDDIAYYGLALHAERVTGAGNLDIDCLILMPVDHYAYIENGNLKTTTDPLMIYTSPLDEQMAVCRDGTAGSWVFAIPSFVNFFYPAEGGIMVLVAAEATQHILTPTLGITMRTYPRYKLFRT